MFRKHRLIDLQNPPVRALRLAALGLVLAAAPAAADAPYLSSILAVRVGHWVEARGELAADGVFVPEEVELLQPQSESALIGTVPATERDPRRFRLLGRVVATGAGTQWRGLSSGSIAGARVKVEGELAADGSFVASSVAERGAGRDRIVGRVDELVAGDGAPIAKILGFDVRLPKSVEHELPLEAIGEAPAKQTLRSSTARGEDDTFGAGVALGTALRLSGQLEVEGGNEQELDLDASEDADRTLAGAGARLRLDWQTPGSRLSGAIEGRGSAAWRFEDAGDSSSNEVRLGETYLAFADLAGRGSELVAGRQDFDDEREWIYDQNLDALRLLVGGERVRFELSASTTLTDGSPRDEAATNFIALLANTDRRRRLAAWVVYRDFDLAVAERATHAGVRAAGRWLGSTETWLDVALFDGKRGAVAIEGWGFDVGGTVRPDWLEPFSFTLGYAYGSGGAPSDGKERTFRQTGLQDNNDKFAGVTSFRYYGELLDPELANLRIATAGIGVRFATRSSLDLVGHLYEQDTARGRLVDTALDRRPDGVHTELGWEADLVFGSRESPRFDLEIVAAYFDPGAAFPDDAAAAFLGKAQLRFRF